MPTVCCVLASLIEQENYVIQTFNLDKSKLYDMKCNCSVMTLCIN